MGQIGLPLRERKCLSAVRPPFSPPPSLRIENTRGRDTFEAPISSVKARTLYLKACFYLHLRLHRTTEIFCRGSSSSSDRVERLTYGSRNGRLEAVERCPGVVVRASYDEDDASYGVRYI